MTTLAFQVAKGRELHTDDVLYSLKRFANANINTQSWEAFNLGCVGLRAWREASQQTTAGVSRPDIAGFKRTGRYTFTTTLEKPNPQLLAMLARTVLSIVPPEAVLAHGDDFGVQPVGTGPFMLGRANRKGVSRFTQYPRCHGRYHGRYPSTGEPADKAAGLLKAAGRQLPLVDRVEMPLIEEAQPAVLKFLRGELDLHVLDRAGMTRLVDRSVDGQMRLQPEFAARVC